MSTSLTLYDLEDSLRALLDTADGMEDEDPNLPAVLGDIAEANMAALQKRDNCIRFLRHLDIQEAGIDAEVKRLQALKGNYGRGRERLEKYLVSVLDSLPEPKRGTRKLEGTIGVLAIRKNPDRVIVTDESAVPAHLKDVNLNIPGPVFLRILDAGLIEDGEAIYSYHPRKSDIKRAIESGEDVPGADVRFGENRLVLK